MSLAQLSPACLKITVSNCVFQTVYECIDKITQFMSRAAIFSFLPILTKILPESITNMERGRYYRNR